MFFRVSAHSVFDAGATAPLRPEEGTFMTALTHRIRSARRLAGIAAIGVCALAAAAAPAVAGGTAKATHGAAGKTLTLRYYSQTVTFIYRKADGTVLAQPPQGAAVGDQMEITELGYKGTTKKHAKKWSVSAYTICVFHSTKGAPTCEGIAALGGNQLLTFHTAPDSDHPQVVGGRGRYAGATGSVDMQSTGDTSSDLVITVNLKK
jgi:hypothetical protein